MVLIFDITMLKSFLRELARRDGVVPFQTTTPHVASGVVAPYADRYVDSVRNEVIYANTWRQGSAAMWAGTVRMAMMISAGLVDFFGPIAEESLGEAAVRMAQETVNGVFTLPIRLANIMIGPASEAPIFDQTLAQTEWALSAASYLYGAKSMMGGGPLSPVRVSILKPVIADGGAPNGFGANLQGILLRVSDVEVAAALEKHGGHRGKAATELGIAPSAISRRVTGSGQESLLAKYKTIKGKGGKLIVTDEQLVAALMRHQGNRHKTARDLGVQPCSVSHRVWGAPEGSALAGFKVVKGDWHRGRPVKVSDADLLAALERHQGNRCRAGREVGLYSNAVKGRIERASEDSPFAKYKTLKGKAGSIKGHGLKATDQQILEALQRYGGSRTLAALDLDVSIPMVSHRIVRAEPGSILAEYKLVKGKPRRPPRINDVEILEPLEIPFLHLDDATIAKALLDNRQNIFKAALQLKCSTRAIAKRIELATDNSPLAPLKNKRR